MCPARDEMAEGVLIARKRTLGARIAQSLTHIAAELSDEECLRVRRAMLKANGGHHSSSC